MSAERRVEKPRADHKIEGFDCGRKELNRYLLRYAWSNQLAGVAQTSVGLAGDWVVGYHTRAVGQVSREEAPERLTKDFARHPVPILLLVRLSVDRHWHGQGVGKSLLKDAIRRTLQAADIAGIRAFAVHVKDCESRSCYEKFDFGPSPTDPMHLFVLLKDVRRIIAARSEVGHKSSLSTMKDESAFQNRCRPSLGLLEKELARALRQERMPRLPNPTVYSPLNSVGVGRLEGPRSDWHRPRADLIWGGSSCPERLCRIARPI